MYSKKYTKGGHKGRIELELGDYLPKEFNKYSIGEVSTYYYKIVCKKRTKHLTEKELVNRI